MITAVNPVQQSQTKIQTNQPAFKSIQKQKAKSVCKKDRSNVSFTSDTTDALMWLVPFVLAIWGLARLGIASAHKSLPPGSPRPNTMRAAKILAIRALA